MRDIAITTTRRILALLLLAASAAAAFAGPADRLYQLGLAANPADIPVFLQALTDRDLAVRKAAASQLIFVNAPEALGPIKTALQAEKSTFVRRCLIEAASRLGTPEARAVLEAALKDAAEINRLAAAERLLRAGDHAAARAEVLTALKSHDRESVLMACYIAGANRMEEAAETLAAIAMAEENGGENSRDTFALRALNRIAERHPSARPQALKAARAKTATISPFMRVELARIIGNFGEAGDLDTLHGWVGGQWVETQLPATRGLARLKNPASVEPVLEALKLALRPRGLYPTHFRIFTEHIRTLTEIGDPRAIEPLKKFIADLPAENGGKPVVQTRILAVNAAGTRLALGEAAAAGELAAFLRDGDASVRREAAKRAVALPDNRLPAEVGAALAEAAAAETEPYTALVLRRAAAARGLPAAAGPAPVFLPAEADTTAADTEPRYVMINLDDSSTIDAMERVLAMCEFCDRQGRRLVFRLMVAPASRFDQDYLAVLLKRLYDRGCEIGNHTFTHNNDGFDYLRLPEHEMEAEFRQCQSWLRDRIPGLERVYAFWSGGSGFRPREKTKMAGERSRELAVEWGLATDIPYDWPRSFNPDFLAPPYHDPGKFVSWHTRNDLSSAYMFDSAEEGIEALKSSFRVFYANPGGRPMFFGHHDWPLGEEEIRPGVKLTYEVLWGFLKWALVEERNRFPNFKGITPLEYAYITAGRAAELENRKEPLQNGR